MVHGRDPGWYPDPSGSPPTERYWDGTSWGAETRQGPPPQPADSAQQPPGPAQYQSAPPQQPPGPPQPAGWYQDPGGSQGVERYWDGAGWTDSYRMELGAPYSQPKPGVVQQ